MTVQQFQDMVNAHLPAEIAISEPQADAILHALHNAKGLAQNLIDHLFHHHALNLFQMEPPPNSAA